MGKAQELKNLLKSCSILVAPGCYDCITAMLVELIGFQVAYLSGYGSSASLLGLPDMGLMTFSEIVGHARNVVNRLNIPVICDADNGYGNQVNVVRTVREFEKAGVAAIHLEDQVFPKKCGHMEGKRVVSASEHAGKIKAAVDTRKEMLIIARTDAKAPLGYDEAIRRCNMYLEAGADMAFMEAFETADEVAQAPKLVRGPLVINMAEGGKTPLIEAKRLEDLGYKLLIHSDSALNTTIKAVSSTYRELLEKGTTKGILNSMIGFKEFNSIIRTWEYEEIEKKYSVQ